MALRRPLSLVAVLCLAACGGDPIAPDAVEPLSTEVVHRARVAGERLPTVRLTSAPDEVRVTVARDALCMTRVDARVARSRGELDVVARVSPNPAALCIAGDLGVVEYTMIITSVSRGFWEVRVFEGEGRSARFIDEGRVRVPN